MTLHDKAKMLSFTDLTYKGQWEIFETAQAMGWTEKPPSVLGTHHAKVLLEGAIGFIADHYDFSIASSALRVVEKSKNERDETKKC